MSDDLRALVPHLKGAAAERVTALFEGYGLAEAAHRDLQSRNALGRIHASDTLGLMGVVEAAPWLRDGLAHEDPLLRLSCARALADLGEIDALPEIMGALAEEHAHTVETTDILLAFGAGAVPFLRDHLRAGPAAERRLAAGTLGELQALEAVPELRVALSDDDDELASAAARALGRIGDSSVCGALLAILSSERTWFVQVVAAHALGALNDPGAAPALVDCLSAPGWDLRNAAAGALRAMDEAGLQAVTERLDDIPDRGVAHYAGRLDTVDRLGDVIARAAEGDGQLLRLVRRACSAGVHARLEELEAGDEPLAAFCGRVLRANRPAEAIVAA
jgi:HEAT repeat protein